jgi:hypothetical protein
MLRAMCVACLMLMVPLTGDASGADPQRRKPAPAKKRTPTQLVKDVTCPADLGVGVKSKRSFCDVTIATDPVAGIFMRIPPHTGNSTLLFDLHNRFPVSGRTLPYVHGAALVAVLNGNNGTVIERAAVMGDLRTELDLFDRLKGAGPGGTKTVAPGRSQAVTITLPAAVTSISIVGVRVELTGAEGRTAYTTVGRPVAIASNFRIEYTPATVKR